jgi:hypothetical protein
VDVYICLGSSADHLVELAQAAASAATVDWTVAATAKQGDDCFFYMVGELRAFVARGRLRSSASKALAQREGFPHHYMAEIGSIRLLEWPVPLRKVRSTVAWGWLDQPRMSARVPRIHVPDLLDLLT